MLEESGIVLFTGNNLTTLSLPALQQQTPYSGLGSISLWALSLVTDGNDLDTTKALIIIKDEPLVNISIPSLSIAYDFMVYDVPSVCACCCPLAREAVWFVSWRAGGCCSGSGARSHCLPLDPRTPPRYPLQLSSLNVSSLSAVTHTLALKSMPAISTIDMPQLYMSGNLTVQSNSALTSLSVPMLQDVSMLSLSGNENLASMNASSLRFVEGFNYTVEVSQALLWPARCTSRSAFDDPQLAHPLV